MKIIAIILCASMLFGCASFKAKLEAMNNPKPVHASYVAPDISEEDAAVITKSMAQFLGRQMAYAKTTLELEPLQNRFHAQLRDQLRGIGFGVTENIMPEQDTVPIYYFVTPFDSGVLVRLAYQEKMVSLFFDRTASGLIPKIYAMREVTK